MLSNNRGVSFIGVVIGVIVIALAATYGVQIGIGIMDKSNLERIAKTALLDAKNNSQTSSEIKTSISKKAAVNNIKIGDDDILVKKTSDDSYTVDITYIKEISLTKHVKIVLDYDIEERTQ